MCTALSKTWTFEEWDEEATLFGGPTRNEDFYRNMLEALVCVFKSLVMNVSNPFYIE